MGNGCNCRNREPSYEIVPMKSSKPTVLILKDNEEERTPIITNSRNWISQRRTHRLTHKAQNSFQKILLRNNLDLKGRTKSLLKEHETVNSVSKGGKMRKLMSVFYPFSSKDEMVQKSSIGKQEHSNPSYKENNSRKYEKELSNSSSNKEHKLLIKKTMNNFMID